MAQYFRDSDVQADPRFRLHQVSCRSTRCRHCMTTASRPSARIATSSSDTGSTSIRTPGRAACANCAAASTSVSASSASPCPLVGSRRRAIRSVEPFYKLCIEAGIPVLIFVGTTGLGAGLAGRRRRHPRSLPSAPPRPGRRDTIPSSRSSPRARAGHGRPRRSPCCMHKRNIWYELHGWSPKYHTADLKHEIPRRLQAIASCSAPTIRCSPTSGLIGDWRAQGYPDEVLEEDVHQQRRALSREAG